MAQITRVLQDDKMLRYFMRQVQIQRDFTAHIHSLLPTALHPHCWVGDYINECLTLCVDSSMVAARLRLQQISLQAALQEQGIVLQSLAIKVTPRHQKAQYAKKIKPKPSVKAQSALQSCADGLADDSPLKLALQTFIQHAKQR